MDVRPQGSVVRLVVLLAIVVIAAASAASHRAADGMTEGWRAAHLLNRATMGPTRGELARLESMGARAWLREQLRPPDYDPGLRVRLELFPDFGRSPAEVYARRYEEDYEVTADGRRELDDTPVLEHLRQRQLLQAVTSRYQLREVMVDFWLNHFNVFFHDSDIVKFSLPSYVEQEIRPRALGRFRDLLGAVARSPAMLVYLDNWVSSATWPGGLNENYARELLELHTVGLRAGYTQRDVREAARCLAGWTVGAGFQEQVPMPPGAFQFRFDPGMHDDGWKTVMSHRFPPRGGVQDGERLLDLLASHESTARHVSEKLVRRFVDDDPPRTLVDRAAAVFLRTDGDIARTLECVLESTEFYEPQRYRCKMKTPLEVVASSLRVLVDPADAGAWAIRGDALAEAMEGMGAPLFECLLPNGYPDTADAWNHPGSLQQRWVCASECAARLGPAFLASRQVRDPKALVAELLPGGAEEGLAHTLDARWREETALDAIVWVMASPEFQLR